MPLCYINASTPFNPVLRCIQTACLLLGIILTIPVAQAQKPVSPPAEGPQRTEPMEPFPVIDNIYNVGATIHNPVYLITDPAGHILIDSSYERMVPDIVENIQELGFEPDNVRYLLSSHAHHDHVGGHAMLREITGATTVATAADKEVIESGGKRDFRDREPWRPGTVDRVIEDGESIRLGETVLTAHLTPGHTKGCTTWTTQVEENHHRTLTVVENYDVVFLCGLNVNDGEPLVGHPEYPDMPQEFAYTFARLKVLPVDVFLGAHGYWYGLEEKLEVMQKRRQMRGGTIANPFIDPEGYYQAIEGWEDAYLQRLRIELDHDAPGDD